MSETHRIADQLTMAFEGDTWTGRPIRDIVGSLTAASAAATRAPGGKSAWEILAHIVTWLRMSRLRLSGQPASPTDDEDYPPITDRSDAAWRALWTKAETEYRGLAEAIRNTADDRLETTTPGQSYPIYHLLHGVIQHSLYHGGQLALLARMANAPARA
jgi:uncharacterized damage-inducible protein DinB